MFLLSSSFSAAAGEDFSVPLHLAMDHVLQFRPASIFLLSIASFLFFSCQTLFFFLFLEIPVSDATFDWCSEYVDWKNFRRDNTKDLTCICKVCHVQYSDRALSPFERYCFLL